MMTFSAAEKRRLSISLPRGIPVENKINCSRIIVACVAAAAEIFAGFSSSTGKGGKEGKKREGNHLSSPVLSFIAENTREYYI